MSDVLVIKVNLDVSAERLKALRDGFLLQKEYGVVVIPSFCEAVVVPEDVEIKVEGVSNGE